VKPASEISFREDREDSSRKYHLDYRPRPDCDPGKRKQEYMYVGYYYSLDMDGGKLSYRMLRWIGLVVPTLQFLLLIGLGFLDTSMNVVAWGALPFAFSLIAVGWSWYGGATLFGLRNNEFVRRLRDQGPGQLRRWQTVSLVSVVLSAVTELVCIVINKVNVLGHSLLYLAAEILLAASCFWMVMAMRAHPVNIVRDGMAEYSKLFRREFLDE